jgi:dephospho-CoA kinase
MSQLIVVLTGGIASGKTQVSQRMSELGCSVIDADQVARDVVEKNSAGWQAVIERFGPEILREDGEINRRVLRALVFNDSDALADLNAITHPLIQASIKSAINQDSNQLIVVVIPLLTQTNQQTYFDRVLVVDVNENTQRQRLQQRDQINDQLTEKMLASQISRTQRLILADDVISNQGTLQDLQKSVDLMFGFYTDLVNR